MSAAPLVDWFSEFAQSLTDVERQAIHAWLNLGYLDIRNYQLTGLGDANVVKDEQNLGTALGKAVICQKPVYRGLSAVKWRPDAMEYLKNRINGDEVHELLCHDSASLIEDIGRAFTRTGPDDEEHNLSVFLKIRPKTARYLAPFKHKAKDEGEVVLLCGSRYQRISAVRKPDPKPNLEFWELEFEEIV